MDKIIYFLTVLSFANAITIFNDDASRILNGNAAVYDEYRYAASIQLTSAATQETRGHRCGGTLISYQHVLTTASCLYDVGANGTPLLISPAQYRVFAGAALLTADTVTDRIRGIANFTIHPNYIGSPSYVNDIAIVTLTTAFSNTTVVPLRVPPTSYDPQDFELCQIAGWGGNSSANVASVDLRYAIKYIYNQQLCSTLHNSFAGSANVIPTMLCAASYDILASGCEGDSGNALVCNGTLAGILMYQQGSCAATSYPELYTRVNNYTTWVTSITGSATTFAPTVFLVIMFVVVQVFVSHNDN